MSELAETHLLTLITRIALPYFVAFISVEAGLTQRFPPQG